MSFMSYALPIWYVESSKHRVIIMLYNCYFVKIHTEMINNKNHTTNLFAAIAPSRFTVHDYLFIIENILLL